LFPIANNPETTLEKKIELLAHNYIALMTKHPDLPLFVLSEIRNNPDHFQNKVGVSALKESSLVKQLQQRRPDIHPIQFVMSLLGMTIFPFVASPLLQAAGLVEPDKFNPMMEQRKQLIPKWVNSILECE
jgi:hypothetical protein